MKNTFLVILFMLSFGCKSIDESKDDAIFHFIDKYVPKLEQYIVNDQNLSVREKNTFLVELNDYKEKRAEKSSQLKVDLDQK